MKTFIALAVVACLTVEVSAGLGDKILNAFSKPQKQDSTIYESDFEAINLWLTKNVNSEEPEANLEAIRTKIVSLSKPTRKITAGTKRAGEILLELSQQSECTHEARKNLRTVSSGGLKLHGGKRYEVVMRPYLKKLLASCATKFDSQNVEQIYERSAVDDKELVDLVDVIAPGYKAQEKDGQVILFTYPPVKGAEYIVVPDVLPSFWNRILSYTFQAVDTKGLIHYVQAVLKKAGKQVQKREDFDSDFDQHFLQPCRRFRTTVGKVMNDARLLHSFKRDVEKAEFIKNQSATFRRLGWTDKICSAFTNMDNGDEVRELIFNKLSQKPQDYEWTETLSSGDYRYMFLD